MIIKIVRVGIVPLSYEGVSVGANPCNSSILARLIASLLSSLLGWVLMILNHRRFLSKYNVPAINSGENE